MHLQLKEQERLLREQKNEEERTIAPLKRAVEKLDSCLGKYRDQIHKLRGSTASRTLSAGRKYVADKETTDAACNELSVQIEQAEKSEAERMQRLDGCMRKIASAEAELQDLIANFDGKSSYPSLNRRIIIP